MKRVLSCTALLVFPLLVNPALGIRCGPKEYPSSASKCCKKCSPGEEMAKRCTAQTETQCVPCETGYYSQDFNEDSTCTACTICDKDRGLQEVQKCERTSNTVCTCLPGYSPGPHQDGAFGQSRPGCIQCRPGFFSKGGKDVCQPWTNCTAKGRKRLRAGSREEDAVCDDHIPISPKFTVATTLLWNTSVGPATTPSAWTTRAKEEPLRTHNWGGDTEVSLVQCVTQACVGSCTSVKLHENKLYVAICMRTSFLWFLMIFLICATVVLATGGSVLCFLKSKQHKKKQRELEVLFQGDRKSSYRIPIQEEQVDYKSSLVQN